jgi:dTDP-glucose 4,6-dehydratase
MKVLVTGGLGFIGSNLIRHLLAELQDAQITNVDNLSIGANPANLEDLKAPHRYRFIKGDITDKAFVSKLVRKHEVVINCAAETHVDRSIANPNPFLKSNVLGTFRILEALRKNNPDAKMVHVSTDEIYGDILEGSFDEDDRPKPSNPYAASKSAADMFALAYQRTYGIDVVITRCTNNFGPYQHLEKLIPKTIVRAIHNLAVPLYGTGTQMRDWIYVLDHCEALKRVIEAGRSGQIYNISTGREISNVKVVESILEILGKPRDLIQFVEDRPGHDTRYSLNSQKIRSEIGWAPRYAFQEALERTVRWYVDNKWWWRKQASKKILDPTPWKRKW